MKTLIIIALALFNFTCSFSQTVNQTVRGKVIDQTTQEELYGVTIVMVGSDPLVGTTTDFDGTFELTNIPVGRQSFEFRMVGYEPLVVSEVLVSSGKEVTLNIGLKQMVTSLGEVVVVFQAAKEEPLNEMATVSSRQFTVEETQRYAGGMNDPARLVSSFAGVASPSISSNGISVRGNSPSGLLWRIEGVEVPSPNHFADLSIAGAGVLTALSSQVLGNSDFMTGAFAAEYGNATSGVFDMNLRNGNSNKREHTAHIGILGVDLATEGPFKKGGQGNYVVNYRYSTLALVSPMLPSDAGILKYQDLSFNIGLPTKKYGKFSLWGVGAYDGVDMDATDSTQWETDSDRDNSQTTMNMFASGLKHKINLGTHSLLTSSLSISGNGLTFQEQRVNDDLQLQPLSDAQRNNYKITLQSSLSTAFGERHFNRTGFYANSLGYNLDINHAEDENSVLEKLIDQKGQSTLLQVYSQSQVILSSRWTLNAGFHSQYFQLNKDFSFEPRLSATYKLDEKSNLGLAYGLHSKIEPLSLYFIKDEFGNETNRKLKTMRSQHVVLSYNRMLHDDLRFSIEPYFQRLTNVPVSPDSYVSSLNSLDNLFFNEVLVSDGTGRNIGIDATLEQYLNNGFYASLTASIFDSKYKGSDGIQRNTRLNKNYVFNAVVGKEWQVGRGDNNTFSANVRLNYLGGNRVEAVDALQSVEQQKVVYGETPGNLSFSKKYGDTPIWSFTLSYRKNKPNYSSVWSLQVLNSSYTAEFDYHTFNANTQTVDSRFTSIMIPNLSYKIEF